MSSSQLESVALALVAEGKGVLAADETIPTLTKRFQTLGIQSTEQSRRTYREMLFTCPDAAEFISGAIMYDETIRQKSSGGSPLVKALAAQGILPGIKVDAGATPLAGSPGETVTERLDGLRDRLSEYRSMGARFAKCRAVIRVTETVSGAKPWKISFSYGRALQDSALEAWHGIEDNLVAGQRAFYHRARSNGAACAGKYMDEMEAASQGADDPPDRQELRDD